MRTLIVIPARYGSTRFPAKPLHAISGMTLLARVVHVARAAANATGADLVVATDHAEIVAEAERAGAPAVMTDPDLASGTDRALAALNLAAPDADFVLNLQGDAPFTPPEHLTALIKAAEVSPADVVTPVVQLSWSQLDALRSHKRTTPFSGTTCVRAADGRALWFSKSILPARRKEAALRAEARPSPVWRHIGLYGYRRAALERFSSLPLGVYEALEGLEQLRFLENGMRVDAVAVGGSPYDLGGVDTLEDAAAAEDLISKLGDPHQR